MIQPAFNIASGLLAGVWYAIWPARCPLCYEPLSGSEADSFCSWCRAKIKRLNGPVCGTCGRDISGVSSPAGGVCGFCETQPPAYDLARAYGLYGGALREAISSLKFKGQRSMAPAMARLVVDVYEQRLADVQIDAVVPVPLHKSRIRERGFNQATDLARPVAKRAGLPLFFDTLVRTRPTEPQYGLTINQRKENMRGAFSVKRPERIKGFSILVVDDILTTGTTANECAKVLKRAGAKKVVVLTLTRAN